MRVYIAGKIGLESERDLLEKVDILCKNLGLKTFLPHRDAGVAYSLNDTQKIFKKDIKIGLDNSDLVIAVLDGLHIGAGTAWELGYAYAKKIPCLGLKTDEKVEDCLEQLSAIIIESLPIVRSLTELEHKIKKLMKN